MRIALIGYGKMGQAVEHAAEKRQHTIVLRAGRDGIDADALKSADVAIEFTRPSAAPANLELCLRAGIPVVTGTTGWYAEYDRLTSLCSAQKGALLAATNFSVGVNLFFDLNRKLAALMNRAPEYQPVLDEIHHIHKLDSPSGTAITLANDLVHGLDRISQWKETDSTVAADVLPIHSKRIGETVGTHVITYTSGADRIEIKHEAFSRDGFAAGAVLAAEWIIGKKGVFTMKDVLGLQ